MACGTAATSPSAPTGWTWSRCATRRRSPTPRGPRSRRTRPSSPTTGRCWPTARPDVVIICTPPHTHLDLATDVLRAGCDILLEKPPVLSLAEHTELMSVAAETGRIVQVGFQALGSRALTRLLDAVRSGAVGEVTGVAAVGSWRRSDAYYSAAPGPAVDGWPAGGCSMARWSTRWPTP